MTRALFIFSFIALVSPCLMGQSLIPASSRQHRLLLEDLSLTQDKSADVFLGFSPTAFETFELRKRAQMRLDWNHAHIAETPVRVPAMGSENTPVLLRSLQTESQGLDIPHGSSSFVRSEVGLSPTSWLALRTTLIGGTTIEDNSRAWYHLAEAYAEFKFVNSVISIGRKPMNWGQSFVGPLLLSDNSTPLDSIQITSLPVRLPWILDYLGLVRAEIFYSRMNADRLPQHDQFVGWRLGVKPNMRTEVNVAAHYQFGGKQVRGGAWDEVLLEIFGVRKDYGEGPKSSSNVTNRAAQIDFRIKFPELKTPLSVYGENHLEDCCGGLYFLFRRQLSYLYGFYLRTDQSVRAQKIRVEYVKTGNKLYFHDVWLSALSNEGSLMGHPIGNDAQGVYVDWMKSLWAAEGSLRIFWEERNRRGQIDFGGIYLYRPHYEESEKRYGTTPGVEIPLAPDWRLNLRGSIIRVINKENYGGRNTFEWGTLLSLGYNWKK